MSLAEAAHYPAECSYPRPVLFVHPSSRPPPGDRTQGNQLCLATEIILIPFKMSDKNTSTLQSVVDQASGAVQSVVGSITGNTSQEVRASSLSTLHLLDHYKIL